MALSAKHEIIRRNVATTPIEYSAHLISAGDTLFGDPLPQAGYRHTADFPGGTLKGQFALREKIRELHIANIPHCGEYGQPRFGERRVEALCGKLPNMGNRIKEHRLRLGLTHEAAAAKTGMSRSQFIKLERGERRLTSDYIAQIARGFGLAPADIISEVVDSVDKIPIVGLAGAGPDGTVLFSHGDGGLGYGPTSPNSNADTKALEVRGDSMRGIANDGWLVYFEEEQLAPTDELIGELCVVGLEDDRVMVKVLQPGRGPGLFDLESFNAPVMRDVPLRWACLVTSIIPRKPARRLIKQETAGSA